MTRPTGTRRTPPRLPRRIWDRSRPPRDDGDVLATRMVAAWIVLAAVAIALVLTF